MHLGQRENYDEFDHYDDDVESLGEYLLMTMLNLMQVNILDKEDRQVSLPINPDGRQVGLQLLRQQMFYDDKNIISFMMTTRMGGR